MSRRGVLVVLLLATMTLAGGTGSAGGGFDVVLRTYYATDFLVQDEFLRLEASEAYDNYHWRLDAASHDGAAAGFVRVRGIGSGLLAPEFVCQGPVAAAGGIHVHQACDDLRVQTFYELVWTANDPSAVLTLRGF